MIKYAFEEGYRIFKFLFDNVLQCTNLSNSTSIIMLRNLNLKRFKKIMLTSRRIALLILFGFLKSDMIERHRFAAHFDHFTALF